MILSVVKKILRKFGFEINRINKTIPEVIISSPEFKSINDWLKNKDFKTVIDIGANTGQFASKIRALLPAALIISFEPIPEVFEVLNKNFSNDPNFIAHNIGLGSEKKEMSFYKNDYSDSSSVLQMNSIHKELFEYTRYEKEITINLDKLDNIIDADRIDKPLLLKIDVQGYEKEVLSGAVNVVNVAEIIITEVSFTELYKTQPLFDDIYQLLTSSGLKYIGNFDQLLSPSEGRILQADAIFARI